MENFKIGDRVILTTESFWNNIGETGVILTKSSDLYGIVCDNFHENRHDLEGMCKDGYGVWLYEEDFGKLPSFENTSVKIPNYEIHISCKDGKTTNLVYKVDGEIISKTQAKLAPNDKFSIMEGANICLARLDQEINKPKTKWVFDAGLCINNIGYDTYKKSRDWVDKCHGWEVDINTMKTKNGSYTVTENWIREVPVNA